MDEETSVLVEIPLHFDVAQSYLPLSGFIEAAHSAKQIIDNLNITLCDGELDYQILVLPPESGTFLQRIGLLLGAAFVFIESTNGAAFVKGLTGQEPAYWSENIGKEIKSKVAAHNPTATTAKVIAECTKGFLQKSNDELREANISQETFRDAYEARNKFYMSCVSNPDVKGVGFDESKNFPIRRNDFPNFVVSLPAPKEDPIASWQVETKDVIVTSPNWERDQRHWKGKYGSKKVVWFTIEDEMFWHIVEHKGLKTKIFDILRVQWAFPTGTDHRSHVRVLKVLKYNNKNISKPLTGDELSAALENYSFVDSRQKDLFGEE